MQEGHRGRVVYQFLSLLFLFICLSILENNFERLLELMKQCAPDELHVILLLFHSMKLSLPHSAVFDAKRFFTTTDISFINLNSEIVDHISSLIHAKKVQPLIVVGLFSGIEAKAYS